MQSLSFRGIQGQAGGPSPDNQVQSLSCRGIQGLVKGPSPKGRARRSPSGTLLTRRMDVQATKGDLDSSHYKEVTIAMLQIGSGMFLNAYTHSIQSL